MTPGDTKIVYVSREIERTLGIEPNPAYLVVSNKTTFGESIKKSYPDFVTLIESPKKELLGTTDLLQRPETSQIVAANSPAAIIVFKNTLRVESAAKSLNCKLLNPNSALSERVENKLSQVRWLGPLATKYLPPHVLKVARYITWKNSEPFIIQWGHGHTGDGTMLIRNPDELRALQEKFPDRMARLTTYISGPSFTVNVVVHADRILIGNPSYQITGLQPFTDGAFNTVGNDWELAGKFLSEDDRRYLSAMAEEIGLKLQTEGWRGFFGIDVVRDDVRGRLYLIEVNARQPASAVFESSLQEDRRAQGLKGITVFEAHLRALQGLPIDQDLIEIETGAQIIQRVTHNVQSMFDDVGDSLMKMGYKVIAYQNTDHNADLLRIQSAKGIMESHGSFNATGREIADVIKSSHFKIEV
jgi:hypothetical protein